MRWDAAVAAWLAPIAADTDVTDLLGLDAKELNLEGEQDYAVPGIQYTLLTRDVPFQEVYWRTRIQLDFWTSSLPSLVTLEKALVRLLHLQVPATIGTIPMWTQKIEGGGPLPGAKDGVFSGSMDFRLIYLRDRYST